MRFLLIGMLVATLGCATAPQEAAPLNIVRTPPKAPPRPLVIERRTLNAVLAQGPGRFLQSIRVQPARIKGSFIGFQILRLYGGQAPHPEGVHVGDIVTAVNGTSIRHPDDLMNVWSKLKKTNSVRIDIIRKRRPLRITYRIITPSP